VDTKGIALNCWRLVCMLEAENAGSGTFCPNCCHPDDIIWGAEQAGCEGVISTAAAWVRVRCSQQRSSSAHSRPTTAASLRAGSRSGGPLVLVSGSASCPRVTW
jgi:hypothetical protein